MDAYGINDVSQLPAIEQTRRAAPDVNRVDLRIRKTRWQANSGRIVKLSMPANFFANTPHIRRKTRDFHHTRMKIAVRALGLTKRNLHVNTEFAHHLENFSIASPRWRSTLLGRPCITPRAPLSPVSCV